MIFSALLAGMALANVTIDRLDYHGWPGCYRLSNHDVELIYVPQIGRIMRFALIGKPNVLWESRDRFGKTASSAKPGEWANYGGDKIWPAPQSNWNWPPDPILDGAPYEVIISGSQLVIKGQASTKSGVRFNRVISMEPSAPVVQIQNMMTNTSAKSQSLALWEIAQTNDPDIVFVPIQVTSAIPNGWAPYDSKPIPGEFASLKNGQLQVHRDPKSAFKLGSGSERGELTCFTRGEVFTMKTKKASGTYVDGGKFLAVYSSNDPDKYMELEMTGPLRQLAPGQTTSMVVTWQIKPAN